MTRTEYIGVVDGLQTWNVYDNDGALVGTNQSVPPTVPDTVTAVQIRLWLSTKGITPEQVSGAIALLPDGVRQQTEIEWEYSPVVHRSSSMLAQMAAGFGMDAAAIDQAFIEASGM
jgi:hypothetical protein